MIAGLTEQWASTYFGQWWSTIPWGLFLLFFVVFSSGQLIADWANDNSWLREKWQSYRRIFDIENVVPVHLSDTSKEWLEITAHIRFLKQVRGVTIVVRVHECVNLDHAKNVFVLKALEPQDVEVDQIIHMVLAVVPLKQTSAPPGYQVWGDRYRESGDTYKMKSLLGGSENVVEIEARNGGHIQKSKIYLAPLNDSSRKFGRVFVKTETDVTNIFAV